MEPQGDSTDLVRRLGRGDKDAVDGLASVLQAELREMADALMRRELPHHTLQPTALVNEAYLRLVDQRHVEWQDRAHFLAVAARIMRRVVMDHARARRRQKRGGDVERLLLDSNLYAGAPPFDPLELDEALETLRTLDQDQHRIAELRLFGGLDTKEVALVLGASEEHVRRDWRMARRWLQRRLQGE